MNVIEVVLLIIAIALAALHAILWRTVASYRDPLVLHVAVIVGFVGTLLGALNIGT
jgi:hypothetical protein